MKAITQQDIKQCNDLLKTLLGRENLGRALIPSIAVSNPALIGYFKTPNLKARKHFYAPSYRKNNLIACKPGKFFTRHLPELKAHQIAEKVAIWKSKTIEYTEELTFKTFDSGSREFLDYYDGGSYTAGNGSLSGSCMKRSECRDYLTFYANYDCKLLVLLDSSGLVRGRAIIWQDVYFSKLGTEKDFMDRIYVNNDNDAELFKQYARDNDTVYKQFQNYNDKGYFTYKTENFSDDIEIDSKRTFNIYDRQYPYLDTMSFMDDCGALSNTFRDYELDKTDGGGVESQYICDSCGENLTEDEIFCDPDDGTVYCEGCYSDRWAYCETCEEDQLREDGTIIDGCFVCYDCVNSNYIECSDCGELMLNEDVRDIGEDYYCQDCFENNHSTCADCGEMFHDDDLENGLCDDCIDNQETEAAA